jgi:hypothetical protein
MSLHLFSRCALAFVAALLAACSSSKPEVASSRAAAVPIDPECRSNRRACIYEGSYEPGERHYAEEAARRLNEAQVARLRSASRR